MKQKIYGFIFLLILALHSVDVSARQPYHATVTVDKVSETVTAPNLVDLKNDLQTTSLEKLFTFYTPTTATSIDFNLRGIKATASFAANSTALVVKIPQTGTTQTFTGSTRDQSLALFKEYIHDAGTSENLLRAYYRYSPIDPIAGNPNSLMAQMGQSDYWLGRLTPSTGCDCGWSAQPVIHQFQVGVLAGRAFSKGFDTTVVTVPLRYSWSPNCAWAFIIDAPLTYFRNGGASSLYGSLGFGLRIPITPEWTFTPVVRGGAGGSLDLCTAGSFFSAGLTSVYNLPLCDNIFSMTNYAGYITSTNLWLSGINFNYHLQSYVFKNGLLLAPCSGFCLCGRTFSYNLWFEDTYYEKKHLFIREYEEIGVSINTKCVNPCVNYDCLSVGFTYQFGQKHYRGYQVNLIYLF